MWEQSDQSRWEALSSKRDHEPLSDSEAREYERLAHRLEAEEYEALTPTLDRLAEDAAALGQVRLEGERLLDEIQTTLERRRAEDRRLQQRAQAFQRDSAKLNARYLNRTGTGGAVVAGTSG